MSDILFEGVGKHARVEHVAVQTAFGKLQLAAAFFERLGYEIDRIRMVQSSKWGVAVFMTKNGSIPVQLTDANNTNPVAPGENHLAIMVADPSMVSFRIQQWAEEGNMTARVERVPGGKIFVYLSEVLTMPIELVPNPNRCPDCFGEGKKHLYREGADLGLVECSTCNGSGEKSE